MTNQKQTHVDPRKKRLVKELKKLVETKKTILIASIKNIPASQFQAIGKKLRGKAIVKVPKKRLMSRALDEAQKEEVHKLKTVLDESFAILFSDLDAYSLAGDLLRNKTPAKAKPGQEAPIDIVVEAGPTELVPGPAVSELGGLGISIQIEKGKIKITEDKVIVQKGKKISQAAADVMGKLDIKPFSIGFTPLAAFDNETNTLYTEIKIDREATIAEILNAYGRALPFAVEIGYFSEDTIRLMLAKANAFERKLIRVITGEPEEVAPVIEEKVEEIQEEKKEEEKPVDAGAGLASLFG